MAKVSPNLRKTINSQIQEIQQTPRKITLKRATPRNIIIKLLKPVIKRNFKNSQS